MHPQKELTGLGVNKEYEEKWQALPQECFNVQHMVALNMFSLQKVPRTKDVKYETAYLPFDRAKDFLKGESYRSSNPLDPHDRLFHVTRSNWNFGKKGQDTSMFVQPSPTLVMACTTLNLCIGWSLY